MGEGNASEGPIVSQEPKPRALVVEDDPPVGRAIRRLLAKVGFDVLVSISGRDALRRIGEGEVFGLVVSDIRMPDVDGPSFREAARRLWPEIDSALVFVSGGTESTDTPLPLFGKPLGSDFLAHVHEVYRRASLRMPTE